MDRLTVCRVGYLMGLFLPLACTPQTVSPGGAQICPEACDEGYHCVAGACRAACIFNSACHSGEICYEGVCTPVEGLSGDAGPAGDLGPPDCTTAPDGTACGFCLACQSGACAQVAAGADPGHDCAGELLACDGTCDGFGDCSFPTTANCGVCQECDSAGDCLGIAGRDPFGDCLGDVTECDGTCDGADTCQYPGALTDCGTDCTADGAGADIYSCDGAGGCLPSRSNTCSPYLCDTGEGTCSLGCGDDLDCAGGFYCLPDSTCGIPAAPDITWVQVDVSCGPAPLDVTYTATNVGGRTTGYDWQFGDGGSSVDGPVVTTTYASDGAYDATLTATGPGGESTFVVPVTIRVMTDGWTTYRSDPPCRRLQAMWQNPNDEEDAFAVGYRGYFARRQTSGTWTVMDAGTTEQLNGVAGWSNTTGSVSVWAVGQNGTIVEFDGTSFTPRPVAAGDSTLWWDVYVFDTSNVWVAGAGGNIWKWNGSGWAQQTTPTTYNIEGLGGWGASHLVASVYRSYATLLWTTDGGATWTLKEDTSITSSYLRDVVVTSTSPFIAYLVGNGKAIKYENSADTVVNEWPGGMLNYYMYGMARSANGNHVYATGYTNVVLQLSGGAWVEVPFTATGAMTSVAVTESGVVRVGGAYAQIFESGATWSTESESIACTNTYDVVVVGGGEIHAAVGDRIMTTTDGSDYAVEHDFGATVYDMWSPGPDEAFAVGSGGRIGHWEPSGGWVSMTSPVTTNLRDVYGFAPNEVYAVGSSGAIVRYDGVDWHDETLTGWARGPKSLNAVWGGDGTDVWAGGYNVLARRQSGVWNLVEDNPGWSWDCCFEVTPLACDANWYPCAGSMVNYTAIAGTSVTDVFFAGASEGLVGWLDDDFMWICGGAGTWYCESGSYARFGRVWDGSGNTDITAAAGWYDVEGAWARSPSELYISRSRPYPDSIVRWDGNDWLPAPSPDIPYNISADNITGFDHGNAIEMYIGGQYGEILHYRQCD